MSGNGVLIIYTGGTIGSLRKDRNDPHSLLEPAPLEDVLDNFPDYARAERTITLSRHKIPLGTESFDPPLDSSDMKPADWVRMARIIERHYDDYEGFVILHGTDTLAYTASALAFILENLDKPVVATGSQRPIGEVRTDAEQNLITAVEIAAAGSLGQTVVPEVCVFFRDELYRGCRTTKISARSFNAFGSPNMKPLAYAGDRVVVDPDVVRPANGEPLRVRERFEPNVASLDIFPGMPTGLLRNVFDTPGLKGVVLRSFGNGNVPSDREFMSAVRDAVGRGILIVNATQCLEGEVQPGRYSASAELLALGVVSSLDMTREAALTKIGFVLGHQPDPEVAADEMQLNLRGEQRRSVLNLHFPAGRLEGGEKTTLEPLGEMRGRERFHPDRITRGELRITGLRVAGETAGDIRFQGFMGYAAAGDAVIDVSRRWAGAQGDESVFVPITAALRQLSDPRGTGVTLLNHGRRALEWSRMGIAVFSED